MKFLIPRFTLFILFFIIILANNKAVGQTDSLVLSYKSYLQNLLNHHPIVQKANLKIPLASATMLAAKGSLDPTVYALWNEKNFSDKLYYRQYEAKINVPTKLGIDITGGYQNSNGSYVNPENNIDDFGLWFLGVEVNVLQGLLVNERETALAQAKIFKQLALNEQQIILNDLVYNASTAYLIWQLYYTNERILNENLRIANTYFNSTKQTYLNGEKTAMDTLEAYILYQDATFFLQKNGQYLLKAKLNVENYLWLNTEPISLTPQTVPQNYKTQLFAIPAIFENTNLANHPIILAAINKLTYTEIAQRLKREKLKPKLKLKYNPLIGTATADKNPNFAINNFKWGFNFSLPLLLRSERANIEKGVIKIKEIKQDLADKRNQLQNKIENSWLQQQLFEQQVGLLSDNVKNYERLLNGENIKFNFGESSVFLLNKRQEKYIDSRIKLTETYIQQQIELLNFLYFSNQLIQQ